MLLTSVHEDLTLSITSCESAAKAWDFLAGKFDRDTGNTAVHLFRLLTNLRYRDGDDLRQYIDEFNQLWTRMSKRCATSTHSVAKSTKTVFESDEVKRSFFLVSLPGTIDHIIDNLSTKDITSFTQIEPKMLDIAKKHSIDTVDSLGFSASMKPRPTAKNDQPPQPGLLGSSQDQPTSQPPAHLNAPGAGSMTSPSSDMSTPTVPGYRNTRTSKRGNRCPGQHTRRLVGGTWQNKQCHPDQLRG